MILTNLLERTRGFEKEKNGLSDKTCVTIHIDDGKWDMSTLSDADADCLLQWTLFGELRYEV